MDFNGFQTPLAGCCAMVALLNRLLLSATVEPSTTRDDTTTVVASSSSDDKRTVKRTSVNTKAISLSDARLELYVDGRLYTVAADSPYAHGTSVTFGVSGSPSTMRVSCHGDVSVDIKLYRLMPLDPLAVPLEFTRFYHTPSPVVAGSSSGGGSGMGPLRCELWTVQWRDGVRGGHLIASKPVLPSPSMDGPSSPSKLSSSLSTKSSPSSSPTSVTTSSASSSFRGTTPTAAGGRSPSTVAIAIANITSIAIGRHHSIYQQSTGAASMASDDRCFTIISYDGILHLQAMSQHGSGSRDEWLDMLQSLLARIGCKRTEQLSILTFDHTLSRDESMADAEREQHERHLEERSREQRQEKRRLEMDAVRHRADRYGGAQHSDKPELRQGQTLTIAGASLVSSNQHKGDQVEITVSCRRLPALDWLSESDPMVAIFEHDEETSRLLLVDQTEWIKDEPNPDFTKKLHVYRHPASMAGADGHERDKTLVISVYDIDTIDVQPSDLMACCSLSLSSLLTPPTPTSSTWTPHCWGAHTYPLANPTNETVNTQLAQSLSSLTVSATVTSTSTIFTLHSADATDAPIQLSVQLQRTGRILSLMMTALSLGENAMPSILPLDSIKCIMLGKQSNVLSRPHLRTLPTASCLTLVTAVPHEEDYEDSVAIAAGAIVNSGGDMKRAASVLPSQELPGVELNLEASSPDDRSAFLRILHRFIAESPCGPRLGEAAHWEFTSLERNNLSIINNGNNSSGGTGSGLMATGYTNLPSLMDLLTYTSSPPSSPYSTGGGGGARGLIKGPSLPKPPPPLPSRLFQEFEAKMALLPPQSHLSSVSAPNSGRMASRSLSSTGSVVAPSSTAASSSYESVEISVVAPLSSTTAPPALPSRPPPSTPRSIAAASISTVPSLPLPSAQNVPSTAADTTIPISASPSSSSSSTSLTVPTTSPSSPSKIPVLNGKKRSPTSASAAKQHSSTNNNESTTSFPPASFARTTVLSLPSSSGHSTRSSSPSAASLSITQPTILQLAVACRDVIRSDVAGSLKLVLMSCTINGVNRHWSKIQETESVK
jgi:hypothetical protein